MKSTLFRFAVLSVGLVFFSSCGSMYKQRQAEREKVSQASGIYCEFVNGDDHSDVDVEMNLQMAKKCETTKPYSFSNYRNASDIFGLVYCCTPVKKAAVTPPAEKSTPAPAAPAGKPGAKKADDDIIAQ